MYISEISPIRLRGSMGVCHQMAITITILLSEILGLDNVRALNAIHSLALRFIGLLIFIIANKLLSILYIFLGIE
jgi:hypothetical protein